MPDQPVAVVVTMIATRYELTPEAHRVIQALADEHLKAWCTVAPIDQHTWAIVGTLPYEGEVILAEFDTADDAALAAEVIATSTQEAGA